LPVCVHVSEFADGLNHSQIGSSHYAVMPFHLDWESAGRFCRSLHRDAHLAVITSAQEQQAVAELLKGRYKRAGTIFQQGGQGRSLLADARVDGYLSITGLDSVYSPSNN